MIAWTLPQRRSNAAAPAQPHNHPSKTNLAARGFSANFQKVTQEAMEAESRLVSSGLWRDVCHVYKMTKETELQQVLDGLDDASLPSNEQEEEEGQDAMDLDQVDFHQSDLDQYLHPEEDVGEMDFDPIAAKRALIERHHWHFRDGIDDDAPTDSDDESDLGARKRAKV